MAYLGRRVFFVGMAAATASAGCAVLCPEPAMRLLFRDTAGRLRNGWWILLFLALVAATSLLYTPVSRALQAAGAGPAVLDVLPVVFLLAVT